MLEPITRRLLTDAGVGSGMRVLDVGSGTGDVAFLVAELVGDQGEVIGVDRAAAALETARDRAAAKGLTNVSFREGDPTKMVFDQPFDAVVERYVLLFQPDPAPFLQALAGHLGPSGVIVCQEPDWSCMRSVPAVDSWDRCCHLVVDAMQAGGADMFMGLGLHATFVRAGLPAPTLRMETILGAGADSANQVHLTTDIAVTLLADMERLELVAPGEIESHHLADAVLAEVTASDSVIIGRSDVGAWARVAGSRGA